MTKYLSLNSYCRKKFGCKLYKLSLSCSHTCPNRDGTKGVGGCIFCSEGSGDFASKVSVSIENQLKTAKELVKNKIKNGKYIAYFQSYTSTYTHPEHLRNCLLSAANDSEVAVVSVATRPDCLGEEVLEILEEVSKIKPVWVELGLQTVHDSTAKLINRCSSLSDFDTAISNLKALNIEVILHIILGLPYESEEMMLKSIEYAKTKKVEGVKLQLLHILRGTKLEEMYNQGDVKALSEEEYFEILEKALTLLGTDIVVHRLTGDGAKKKLIAPLWTANKKAVLNQINKRFESI